MNSLLSLVGWLGAGFYILAYLLLSINYFTSNSRYYHVLNALGGIFLVVNSLVVHDPPNLIVNAVWVGIAVYSTIRIVKPKQKELNTQ